MDSFSHPRSGKGSETRGSAARGGNAWILRWEYFARRGTPLPQDDNREREGIGRVGAPAPTWLGKSPQPFAKNAKRMRRPRQTQCPITDSSEIRTDLPQ